MTRSPFAHEPAIAAATEIRPGRYPELGELDMYDTVVSALLRKWSLDPSIVDGLLAAPVGMAVAKAPEIFAHETLADSLGIHPVFSETLNAGGASFGFMAQRAAWAVSNHLANAVLCVGAGKFPKVGGGGGEALTRMVSHPDFDPDVFGAGVKAAEWHKLMTDPEHPLQNRAIQGIYPPGSTFKVVDALAGMELRHPVHEQKGIPVGNNALDGGLEEWCHRIIDPSGH